MTDFQRMYAALTVIANYAPPARLRKQAQREYGLDPDEAIEMAYENVIAEAKAALRGVKKPKPEDGG